MRSHLPRVPPRPALVVTASLLALAAILLPHHSLSAQTVRGRILQAGTGVPVVGALVELRRAADSLVVDRVLTDEGGRFSVEARAAGTFRLNAERIGFRDWTSGIFQLTAGESVSRIIRVSTQPVRVAALSVEAKRKCLLAREQGLATARVWGEVRKALRLTLLSQKGEAYEYVKRDFKRELSVSGHKVRSEEATVDTTLRPRPYTSLPARELARAGFVRGKIATGRTYYAPDVETLLSDPFVETHCIEVAGDRDVNGERWIGLAFRPLDTRSLPDVAGTLWLAAQGSELREMDFNYVNVDLPLTPKHRKGEGTPGGMLPIPGRTSNEEFGGKITFTRLPTGRWIIRDWVLTLPLAGAVDAWWNPNQRYAYVLTGRHEEGGEVLRVRTDSGQVLFQHGRAVLTGFVADSTRGAPLVGAVVSLEGTRWSDTTDQNGRYRMTGLPGGDYRVRVRHPRLDSLGIGALTRDVTLGEGTVREVSFGVPSWRSLLAGGCTAEAGSGTLVGVVRDADSGAPLSGAHVTVLPAAPRPTAGADAPLAARQTGPRGTFGFCGLPPDRVLRVAVRADGRPPVSTTVVLRGRAPLERDLTVPAAQQTGVLGRVEDELTGRPVVAARVRLSGVAGSQASVHTSATDSTGRFRVIGVPEGRYAVAIEAAGYGAARDTVTVSRAAGLRLDVRMNPRTTAVEPIHVEVVGQSRAEAGSAFNPRASRVYQLDQRQIEEVLPRVPAMSDLIRRIDAPGFTVAEVQLDPQETTGVGEMLCVRSAASSSQYRGRGSGCAKVYLNDVELSEKQGGQLLQTLDPQSVCRIQLIPAIEAGARFGTGSKNGVLLIYTRPCSGG